MEIWLGCRGLCALVGEMELLHAFPFLGHMERARRIQVLVQGPGLEGRGTIG